jgi:hypothetical protein
VVGAAGTGTKLQRSEDGHAKRQTLGRDLDGCSGAGEEDWGQLGWVMLRGQAEILIDGREHDQAQELLRSRYPQLKKMQIADLPVIAVRL